MKHLILSGLAAAAITISAPALAEVNFDISIGVPMMVAPPVVVEPQPVYYPPMVAPGYRYVEPRPAIVEVPRRYWRNRDEWHERHEWRKHEEHWRHAHWHRHGDDDDD